MKPLLLLALASAWNRRATLALTVVAIALSVCLLLGVERLREGVRSGFEQSVSGADLIVGARGSGLQLLLYSVFRVGEPGPGMRWASVAMLDAQPAVAWTIPISLGDTHRGFPVVATTQAYFQHFRYGEKKPLVLAQGRGFEPVAKADHAHSPGIFDAGHAQSHGIFDAGHPQSHGIFDAVLGAEVAARLGYRLGSRIALAHGDGGQGLATHADKPFTVVGILARTGTPVDRSVHINLAGMEAIHLDWQGGAPLPGLSIPAQFVQKFDLTPKSVSAVIVGLHSRATVFAVQRSVNDFRAEPLMAILPGVVLAQLWEVVGTGEAALLAISGLVVVVGLAGLVATLLASLGERRRELAVLRANGARPHDILLLLGCEGLGLTLLGAALGVVLLGGVMAGFGSTLEAWFGVTLGQLAPTPHELRLLGGVVLTGLIASLIPAWRAYRLSLADGLTPRL